MQMIEVTAKNAGGRLDKLLLKYLDQTGSGFVYKMLRKKNIVLNGKKAAGNEILREGDRITLYLADDTIRRFHTEHVPESTREAQKLSPWIVYEDDNILAVSKPAGILSQKSDRSTCSLNDMVCAYLAGAGGVGTFTPGIANRLDRNTSGLVLAGKNPAAQRSLSLAVKNRLLHKYYYCIVNGTVTGQKRLEGYLWKDTRLNQVRIYETDTSHPPGAQYICTDYRAVSCSRSYGPGCSLLEVDLITGRPHQIRAHLASKDMPVIGDGKYGDREANDWFRKAYGVKDQLLHACRITFEQMPDILQYLNGMQITAPVPQLFQRVMEGEGLCLPGSQEG